MSIPILESDEKKGKPRRNGERPEQSKKVLNYQEKFGEKGIRAVIGSLF